jgi:hypothetical protein
VDRLRTASNRSPLLWPLTSSVDRLRGFIRAGRVAQDSHRSIVEELALEELALDNFFVL